MPACKDTFCKDLIRLALLLSLLTNQRPLSNSLAQSVLVDEDRIRGSARLYSQGYTLLAESEFAWTEWGSSFMQLTAQNLKLL